MAFIAVVGIFIGFYLWDSWQAQPTVDNLIFILPASVFCGATVIAIAAAPFWKTKANTDGEEADTDGGDERFMPLVLSIVSLSLYIMLLPTLGFDVGTFLFIAAVLVILGERRPIFVTCYALGFAVLTVSGLKMMIPTYIPTLLL